MFGCLAYVHVANYLRSKLDNKCRPCIFLGYGKAQFKFKLWDLIDKKVIRSRDIVFIEEKTIADWEKEKTGSTSMSTENRPPVIDSGRVDDRLNRIEVNPTKIGYEPLDRTNNLQSQ